MLIPIRIQVKKRGSEPCVERSKSEAHGHTTKGRKAMVAAMHTKVEEAVT